MTRAVVTWQGAVIRAIMMWIMSIMTQIMRAGNETNTPTRGPGSACVSFGRNMSITLASSSSRDNHNNKSLTNKFWEWHHSSRAPAHTRNYHQTSSWWLLLTSPPSYCSSKQRRAYVNSRVLWSLKMQVFKALFKTIKYAKNTGVLLLQIFECL